MILIECHSLLCCLCGVAILSECLDFSSLHGILNFYYFLEDLSKQ